MQLPCGIVLHDQKSTINLLIASHQIIANQIAWNSHMWHVLIAIASVFSYKIIIWQHKAMELNTLL